MLRPWISCAVILALWSAQVTAHAIIDDALSVEDVRRPIYRGNTRTRESKSDIQETTVPSTAATPIGESLRAVTKQLLQPTDMVATDVRTPPRVRTKTGEAKIEKVGEGLIKSERLGEGVGEAVPVEVTQAPGLSTWILLSNDQAKGRPATQATIQAVEKPVKKNETIKGKPTITKVPVRKVNSTGHSENITKSPIILQDSKFKNRTPIIVGKVPTTTVENQTKTTLATTFPTPTKKKTTATPTKFVEIVPTTSLVLESATVESTDETSTTETSTTTKRTRRPGTKKKKKNKNRRRRPSKPEEAAESKITQDNNLESNKVESHPGRPLSTRIYNYLAREVMPSVGVGIVGLVLTAGLAGLFLYPFGGGIARRNYEKGTPPQNNYYYSDYVPHREEQSNPPEEKIFNPSTPLSQSSYMSSFDSKYNTNNKYRYEHDYGSSVNGYAGNSEYSTLPDSVKNSDFSLSEGSKYYSMDPISSQYKLTEVDNKYKDEQGYKDDQGYKVEQGYKDEPNYPSLTEYTSYTNAASVGTRGTYETADLNQPVNETKEEDKSDKSQPEFSALVGSPQFTNTDFVGSVSLTGSYGTDGQRTGALAAEHGPRSLRPKREVHDDFSNEIDISDDKIIKKPSPIPTEVSKTETTTEIKTTSEILTSTEHPFETETTTQFNLINYFGEEETVKDEPSNSTSIDSPGGLIGFIKRLVQLKLKIGISLLRSTSDAVQRYFDNAAKKMEYAVRHLEKRRRSLLFGSSRSKRDTLKFNKKKPRKQKEN